MSQELAALENMKTKLQKHLATFAPSISIDTHWEFDPDHYDIRQDCDGFDDEDPDDWQAWQSEVRATAIHGAEELTGSAYLGGTWEKAEDLPELSNPEISGYENQMTAEALQELAFQIDSESPLLDEIGKAVTECKRIAAEEHEAQRNEREALTT